MEYREVYPIEIMEGFTADNMHVMMMYDPKGNRNVPIIIGPHEADMVLIELDQRAEEVKRPMTHQLIGSLMDNFQLRLTQVTIDKFVEGIFYATIYVTDGFGTKRIDARASDAIVLALSKKIPIMMSDSVVEEVGFEVSEDYFNADAAESEGSLEELEEQLRKCEENEEYEKAAAIMEKIERLKDHQ